MRINAQLDVEVIAVETDDQLSVLIEMAAPSLPSSDGPRPPSTLEVVLDRSGSMSGSRLDGAKIALDNLVSRLEPTDNFGLVIFDNLVEVTVPAGPLSDKHQVKQLIAAVQARGSTDLSTGYLRGLQEAQRAMGPTGATVLLISDGHANAGVTDPQALGGIAAKAQANNVTTSTLGYGLGYDERLMSAIARGGSGNELFAEEPDTAGALIAGEVEGLLSLSAQAASVSIEVSPHVKAVQIVNDLPVTTTGKALMAELGSFYSGETRKLVLTFDIPAITSLGLAQVATCTFTWVELPTLAQHTVSVPIHVNIVPGDQAAGRIPDPVVRTELVFLQVQQAKRHASSLLSSGKVEDAARAIGLSRSTVSRMLANAPESMRADLADEAAALAYLQEQVDQGSIARAAKFSSMDAQSKSSKRGRQSIDKPTVPEDEQKPPNDDLD